MSNSSRSFPRNCFACQAKRVVPSHIHCQREVKYDGKMIHLDIPAVPVEKCESCGEYTFGNESEEVIDIALRQTVGLLSPDQILQGRKALGLTQSQLAELLGCAQESISRWESGVVVQSRSADRMFRVFFGVPQARELLSRLAEDLSAGSFVAFDDTASQNWQTSRLSTFAPTWVDKRTTLANKVTYCSQLPSFRGLLTPESQTEKMYAGAA